MLGSRENNSKISFAMMWGGQHNNLPFGSSLISTHWAKEMSLGCSALITSGLSESETTIGWLQFGEGDIASPLCCPTGRVSAPYGAGEWLGEVG